MLTHVYIQALLVDEELADQVWEVWDKGEIDDQMAWIAWWLIALIAKQSSNFLLLLGDNNDKAKPPKDGGGKPRVLASCATFEATKAPKTAELPNTMTLRWAHNDEKHLQDTRTSYDAGPEPDARF